MWDWGAWLAMTSGSLSTPYGSSPCKDHRASETGYAKIIEDAPYNIARLPLDRRLVLADMYSAACASAMLLELSPELEQQAPARGRAAQRVELRLRADGTRSCGLARSNFTTKKS